MNISLKLYSTITQIEYTNGQDKVKNETARPNFRIYFCKFWSKRYQRVNKNLKKYHYVKKVGNTLIYFTSDINIKLYHSKNVFNENLKH